HLALSHDHLPRLGGEEIDEHALFPDPLREGTDVDVQKSLLGVCGRRTVSSCARGPQHAGLTRIPGRRRHPLPAADFTPGAAVDTPRPRGGLISSAVTKGRSLS